MPPAPNGPRRPQIATREKVVAEARRMVVRGEAPSIRRIGSTLELSKQGAAVQFRGGIREIVAELSILIIGEIVADIERATARRQDDPLAGLLAYVRYGVENPELYRWVFSPELRASLLDLAGPGAGRVRGAATFQRLHESRARLLERLAETPPAQRRDVSPVAVLLADALVRDLTGQALGPPTARPVWSEAARAAVRSTLQDVLLRERDSQSDPLLHPSSDTPGEPKRVVSGPVRRKKSRSTKGAAEGEQTRLL
jgi:hypothetical protein